MCFAELKRRENKNLADSNKVKKIKRLNSLQREQRGKNKVCSSQFFSFKSCRLVLFWYGEFVWENLCQNVKHSFTFKNVCEWSRTALFKVWLSWQFQNTVSINRENSITTGLRAGYLHLGPWADHSVKKTKLKYNFQMSFCCKSFQCYDWCENFFFSFFFWCWSLSLLVSAVIAWLRGIVHTKMKLALQPEVVLPLDGRQLILTNYLL